MIGTREKVGVLAGFFLLVPGLVPVLAQSFVDAPISCGQRSPYKSCTAAFDGWTLTISHKHPEGKHSVATYRRCFIDVIGINCAVGEWRSEGGNGPLGGRSIGLRNGLPFPD
jgi:hypothetical protein